MISEPFHSARGATVFNSRIAAGIIVLGTADALLFQGLILADVSGRKPAAGSQQNTYAETCK